MPDRAPYPPLTFNRAFVGLGVGALWGGVMTDLVLTAYFVAGATRPSPWSGPMALEVAKALGFSALAAVPIILFAFIIWLSGLLVLGAPVWGLMHGLGVRSAWPAAVFGALASPALYLASSLHGRPTFVIWALKEEWAVYLILTAIGAVVGWVTIRTAYRRPEHAE